MTTALEVPEMKGADLMLLAGIAEALRQARTNGDSTPPAAVVARCLADLGVSVRPEPRQVDLGLARDDWLRRLASSRRSASTIAAYRVALDDLLGWIADADRAVDPPPLANPSA